MKQFKIEIIFSVNDGIDEQFSIECSEDQLEEELDRNIQGLNQRQDALITKYTGLFPMEEEDRQYYNKLDSEGYYQDGYIFMRKADLKRGYFEGKIIVTEIEKTPEPHE